MECMVREASLPQPQSRMARSLVKDSVDPLEEDLDDRAQIMRKDQNDIEMSSYIAKYVLLVLSSALDRSKAHSFPSVCELQVFARDCEK